MNFTASWLKNLAARPTPRLSTMPASVRWLPVSDEMRSGGEILGKLAFARTARAILSSRKPLGERSRSSRGGWQPSAEAASNAPLAMTSGSPVSLIIGAARSIGRVPWASPIARSVKRLSSVLHCGCVPCAWATIAASCAPAGRSVNAANASPLGIVPGTIFSPSTSASAPPSWPPAGRGRAPRACPTSPNQATGGSPCALAGGPRGRRPTCAQSRWPRRG